MTGSARARLLVKNAFLNGANIWLPLHNTVATDVIKSEECCKLVGGIYKEGTYQPNPPDKNLQTTGVCLCNELAPPCPTLQDGTIHIQENPRIPGTQFIKGIDEKCCNNDSLNYSGLGTWVWDPVLRLCTLVVEDSSCDGPTTITLNETTIETGDCDEVTISAYIYFSEPSNQCKSGQPTDGQEPLDDSMIRLYKNPPTTVEEVSQYSREKNWSETVKLNDPNKTKSEFKADYQLEGGGNSTGVGEVEEGKCCYDVDNPIQARLIIQNELIGVATVDYVDTFTTQQTNLNTNNNVGSGFDVWVKLTTTVSNVANSSFDIAVEFTNGLFQCCNYDVYFDDIEVGCQQTGVRTIYEKEKCVGFDIRHVIDNKKSWVYNPGRDTMSDNIYDVITRSHGKLGLIDQTDFAGDTGFGTINRTFAPSQDAELPFRDTDYFNFHGVVERHSKLVLNSKEVVLQFNMCADNDCIIGSYGYLTDDDGSYILDDDGGRIIVQDKVVPFPNLLQLETFKKTFQGFWIQFMEQFIPATTIFISGEKWCNGRICEQKIVGDYFLDNRVGEELSQPPVNQTITEESNPTDSNSKNQPNPIEEPNGEPGDTTPIGETGNTGADNPIGPIKVGNTELYALDNISPDLYRKRVYREVTK
jgi:hypothetical protein